MLWLPALHKLNTGYRAPANMGGMCYGMCRRKVRFEDAVGLCGVGDVAVGLRLSVVYWTACWPLRILHEKSGMLLHPALLRPSRRPAWDNVAIVCRKEESPLPADRLFNCVNYCFESLGLVERQICQNLAVQGDAFGVNLTHEFRIGHTVGTGGGVDTRDPQ